MAHEYHQRWSPQGDAISLWEKLQELDRERIQNGTTTVLQVPEDAADPWVGALGPSVAADPAGMGAVSRVWRELPALTPRHEILQRASDDIERRALFSWLRAVRGQDERAAMAAAQASLGPGSDWILNYRSFGQQRIPRLVVVPTWQCELRCRYCTIPKQAGRVMSPAVLAKAMDLLLSADSERYALHFFGGEPLLEWSLIERAIALGEQRAPGRIQYRITTNGFALNRQKIERLAQYNVHFQLSLDGDAKTQNAARRTLRKGEDSYERSPAQLADAILESGIGYEIIQVVHPVNAGIADENFRHIVSLGYRRIQINYALGTRWDDDAILRFSDSLHRLGAYLREPETQGLKIDVVNTRETRMRVRTNGEITVDWDGTVMGSNGFLYVPEKREEYRIGHLDDLANLERYFCDGMSPDDLLELWYPADIRANNERVGAVLMSFVRWMQGA